VPTYTLTPTLDIAAYANSWTTYHGNYGISFEYPAIYDEKPYQGICDAIESRDGAHFGEKSRVFVRKQESTSLDKYVLSFIPTYHPDEQFKLESQLSAQINGRPAITVKFKLGEAAESETLIFITDPASTLVFTFSFVGGNACAVPEIGISEEMIFQHAVDTFQFER